MATKWNTSVVKVIGNMAEPQVNAPIIVSCWLEEGDITVTAADSGEYKHREAASPFYTFASKLSKGDNVQLAVDTAYLCESLEGAPIVSAVSGTGGVVGTILDEPRPLYNRPSSTTAANSVAKRVAGLFYRLATVRLDGLAYELVAANGAVGAIAVGDPLLYDVSDSEWIKSGSATNRLALHYSAADSTYVGSLKLAGVDTTQA